jgi:hypothetical protein
VVANPNVPPEIAAKVRLYLQQLAIEAERPPCDDLQRHSLGEQCEFRPGIAGRHSERHQLHPRYPVGRGTGLERRQHRHDSYGYDSLWLRPQEPGWPDRVRRHHLLRQLFRPDRYQFDLTSDVLQDSAFAPFASNDSSPSVDPNKPLPEVSPLSYLEKDGGIEDQSHAVWL